MRITFLLLILCFTGTILLRAQEENKPLPLYVIAPNGLKLREGPGTQFKVLEIAPYKSRVLLMDPHFIQYDTTQKITIHPFSDHEEDNNLTGAWLKIRFKNKDGFMLSTWLYPTCEFYAKSSTSDLNKSYQLFNVINYTQCFEIHDTSADYWYALSVNSENQFFLEKTKIEFLVKPTDMEHSIYFGLMIRRADNKKANRFIRSEKPLTEGKLMQLPVPSFDNIYKVAEKDPLYATGDYALRSKLLIDAKNKELKKVHLQISYDVEKQETKIFSTIQGNKKIMHIEKNWVELGIAKVTMVADIDRDGILDYILEFDYDKANGSILFLSSEAEPGFSHKAVASVGNSIMC